jgi:hypothetical protein
VQLHDARSNVRLARACGCIPANTSTRSEQYESHSVREAEVSVVSIAVTLAGVLSEQSKLRHTRICVCIYEHHNSCIYDTDPWISIQQSALQQLHVLLEYACS